MALAFSTLYTELGDRLSLDSTVSAYATRLKRWINLAQSDLQGRREWSFLQEREMIQTVAQKTAGTVTATTASTTVTGASTAFAATDKRSFIQIQGDTNWYEVTAVSSQVLTISPAFAGTTGSSLTYTLRQVYYDLTSDVNRIVDVRQTSTPLKLINLGVWTLDLYQPDIQNVSPPTGYILFRQNPDTAVTSAKVRQIAFFPVADAAYNIEVRYYKILADLSGDTDICAIPSVYIPVLLDGAEWYGSKFLNDEKEPMLKQQYEYGIQKMIEQENSLGDYLPVLASMDSQNASRFLPFPTTFEQPR